MSFIKRIYGIIVRPRETLKEISINPSIWQAIGVLVGLSLISTLLIFNKNYFTRILGLGASPLEINQILAFVPMFLSFAIFGAMILTPIFHFISTAVYNLLCEFFGYKGRGKGLFTALAFTNIPSLFSSIIYAILLSVNLHVVSIIFSLGIGIWIIVLKIFALKETYSMSGGKATLIYFIPIVTYIVIIGMMIMIGMFSLIPFFTQFSESIGGSI